MSDTDSDDGTQEGVDDVDDVATVTFALEQAMACVQSCVTAYERCVANRVIQFDMYNLSSHQIVFRQEHCLSISLLF